MSQSFYNYIAKELLLGYFKKNPLQKGSRYFMIIENEGHRNKLKDALDDVCESITISGIYQGNSSDVIEEGYNTHVITPSPDSPSIIIGYDKTSTEDYLTTIRNSVGVAGSKYENYGVIYILSDSILSSIITACQDLQSLGGPLHSSYVIRDIQEKAVDIISKDLEHFYLTKHLNKISEYIADGTCNLFDFKNALNVLADGTLKGHYNELDFFNDKAVYGVAVGFRFAHQLLGNVVQRAEAVAHDGLQFLFQPQLDDVRQGIAVHLARGDRSGLAEVSDH